MVGVHLQVFIYRCSVPKKGFEHLYNLEEIYDMQFISYNMFDFCFHVVTNLSLHTHNLLINTHPHNE